MGSQSDEVVKGVQNAKQASIKAVLLLLLGAIIAAVFADPLVDAVDNFSHATSIPSFFISFVVLPLATNSREAVSVVMSAREQKREASSSTFIEVSARLSLFSFKY